MSLFCYFYSKVLKKFRGSAILNSNIHKTSKIESGSQIVNTTMERHSFCGYDCQIINCHIGSFCSIANNVVIGGAMHPIDWVSTSPVFYEGLDSVKKKYSTHKRVEDKKTYIGNDVWIGQNVMIKQGITIGNGAVIGMGSIVTKDIEPYAIVAGNPAKLIRKRFNDKVIDKLLLSKWWEYTDEKIEQLSEHIMEPLEFIENLTK